MLEIAFFRKNIILTHGERCLHIDPVATRISDNRRVRKARAAIPATGIKQGEWRSECIRTYLGD